MMSIGKDDLSQELFSTLSSLAFIYCRNSKAKLFFSHALLLGMTM